MSYLNPQLPADNFLHQFKDNSTTYPYDNRNGNTILNNLIMDSRNNLGAIYKNPNAIIFQINPNKLPIANPGLNISQQTAYNISTTQQLSISSQYSNPNLNITINGFNQNNSSNYVGQLQSLFYQPMTLQNAFSTCSNSQIGQIAQQTNDNTTNNSFYVSQLICESNPLCTTNTGGLCYVPLSNVTIYSTPNQASATCPSGLVISNYSTSLNQLPFNYYGNNSTCCSGNASNCQGYYDAHNQVGGIVSYTAYLNNNSLLPTQVTISPVTYYKTCDPACSCSTNQAVAGIMQPVISSLTCTNDFNKIIEIINVN